MIQVTKSPSAPAPLLTRGAKHRQQLETLHERDPDACEKSENTILHSRDGIYNSTSVKDRLRADQHDKCCYCESLFIATSYGDVEHFRPKAGYQQLWEGPLHKPGYYWLAYEWSNLLFSCQRCNQEFKGNYFPLANDAARAKTHHDDIAWEQPLLLHPVFDNPEQHLNFVQDAIGQLDDRGQASIRGYGLDRPELLKSRADHLKGLFYARLVGAFKFDSPLEPREQEFLAELNITIAQGKAIAEDAKQKWRQAAFDNAEYAGMVRANFPHLLHH
ncbi:hypothetical protein ACFP2F_18420 [Hymenobacter artigasi]|uniref:Uncharacterized protein (TIGR02646 family) n=1 Tax=Hymenobacter artigasi TaxID=2719616 RepID=A0ABX1HJE0_9BACT|nr:hypothetical protein [Hymenobacter artigasi]NKI90388.1 uncharacterized protein (TIGR02646 family) [Hymenobacter artigasi]